MSHENLDPAPVPADPVASEGSIPPRSPSEEQDAPEGAVQDRTHTQEESKSVFVEEGTPPACEPEPARGVFKAEGGRVKQVRCPFNQDVEHERKPLAMLNGGLGADGREQCLLPQDHLIRSPHLFPSMTPEEWTAAVRKFLKVPEGECLECRKPNPCPTTYECGEAVGARVHGRPPRAMKRVEIVIKHVRTAVITCWSCGSEAGDADQDFVKAADKADVVFPPSPCGVCGALIIATGEKRVQLHTKVSKREADAALHAAKEARTGNALMATGGPR